MPRSRVAHRLWPLAIVFALLLPADALAVSWGSTIKLTSSRNAVAWFGLATVGTASAHVVYQDAHGGLRGVYYRRSIDGGLTWAEAIQLSNVASEDSNTPTIVSSGTRLDVVWLDMTVEPFTAVVKYRRSGDNGVTWQGTLAMSGACQCASTPSVVHDSAGRVIVMWTEWGSGAITYRISTNHGASFGTARTLATTTNGGGYRDGLPALAAGSGVIYAAYLVSATSVRVQKTTNGGSSWSSAVTLSSKAFGDPPTVAASGSAAVVAYSEESAVQVWGTTRRTSNAGGSWAAAVPLTSPTSGAPSVNPLVRYAGGRFRVVIERCATVDCLATATWYRESSTGGASWTTAQKVSTSSRPFAVPDGVGYASRVIVLYHDVDPDLLDSDVFVRLGS